MSCSIQLNGQILPLRYTINALCTLEEITGCGLDQLLKTSFSSIRGLLWCGLRDHQPDLTLAEAGDMLEKHLKKEGSLGQIAKALSDALEEAGFFHPGEAGMPPSSP